MGTVPAKVPTTNPLPECAAGRVIASRPAALRSLSQLRGALIALTVRALPASAVDLPPFKRKVMFVRWAVGECH
jgi:hypothetical protein